MLLVFVMGKLILQPQAVVFSIIIEVGNEMPIFENQSFQSDANKR